MFDIFQRLAVPVVLLAAVIASTIALNRVGNEDLLAASEGEPVTSGAVTPIYSIRRVPELLTSPRANDDLTAALQSWVATLPENSCFVVSAAGEQLFAHNAGIPLTPASNMKILTGIAALSELGSDFRFRTVLASLAEPDENGVLPGDLYVLGSGDPVLMSDAYAAVQPDGASPVRTSADELADLAVASNLSTIQGSVLVDESRFDQERFVASWPARFIEQSQAGSLSAAMVDDGFIGIGDGYASQQGVEFPPPLPRSDDPAALFAATFDDLLEARNVIITSRARESVDTPFAELNELTAIESPPLSEIVQQMLVNSDNTTAELLIKELAYHAGGGVAPGSTLAGTLAMSDALERLGLPDVGLFAIDGSGLSSENKVTCGLLTSALDVPDTKDILRSSMPVAGESGTLVERFIGTPFEGRLRAKTGFLGQASSLSGYFVTNPGVEITFAMIVNTDGEETITDEQIDAWQAALPDILASYPAGPPIEDLGPVGVEVGE